jgi:hypothetical protein
MQLLSTTEINLKYSKGVNQLTNITYNKFIKDQYGVQYKSSNLDFRAAMLLFALDSWDNREGADNWLTTLQLLAILDQLAYIHRDPLTAMCSTTSPQSCGCSPKSSQLQLSVMDTESIHLTYINGILSAELKVSTLYDNGIQVLPDGVYGKGKPQRIYVSGDDFEPGTNQLLNYILTADSVIGVWYRGLGFLMYNPDDNEDPDNEFKFINGGLEICIPGFNVHEGNNFFYVMYTPSNAASNDGFTYAFPFTL